MLDGGLNVGPKYYKSIDPVHTHTHTNTPDHFNLSLTDSIKHTFHIPIGIICVTFNYSIFRSYYLPLRSRNVRLHNNVPAINDKMSHGFEANIFIIIQIIIVIITIINIIIIVIFVQYLTSCTIFEMCSSRTSSFFSSTRKIVIKFKKITKIGIIMLETALPLVSLRKKFLVFLLFAFVCSVFRVRVCVCVPVTLTCFIIIMY